MSPNGSSQVREPATYLDARLWGDRRRVLGTFDRGASPFLSTPHPGCSMLRPATKRDRKQLHLFHNMLHFEKRVLIQFYG